MGAESSIPHSEGEQTVTIVRIGANKKYSDNWVKAFGKSAKKSAAGKAATKAAPKKDAKKRKK